MLKQKLLLGLGAMLAGCFIGMTLPAQAQRGGGRGAPGVPVSATYKGLTTQRSYQPIPTTAKGPTTAGGPSIVTTTYPSIHVVPIDDDLRTSYRLNKFYTKTLTIGGIVIVGSDRVSDWAFLEAAYTLDHQLHDSPQWVHDALTTNKVRLEIIAEVEYTMDLPGNQSPQNSTITQGAFQDRRSRGLGGMPDASCAEENLLNLRGDPYGGNGQQGSGENITIHEFSHTVASAIGVYQGQQAGGGGGRGRRQTGPFWDALRKAFADANAPGGRLEVFDRNRPNNKVYAATNEQEYWAEGAQAWFDNANPGNSGGISKRQDVKDKDPELAACLTEIYGDGPWRYFKTTAKKPDGTPLRPKDEMAHLEGLDAVRNQFPLFNFNNSPRIIAAASQAAAAGAAAGNTTTQPATPGAGQGQGQGQGREARRGNANATTTTAPANGGN